MSNMSLNLPVPPAAPAAAGAATPSVLREKLVRMGRAMWRGLEALGQARAKSELLRLAALNSHRPEVARQLLIAARRLHPDD